MSAEIERTPLPDRLSRREFLRSAAVGSSALLSAYLLACGNGKSTPTPTPGTPAFLDMVPTPPTTDLSWEQIVASGTLPAPRRDHSLVTDGQLLYAFGGRSGETMGDLWSFDLASSTWTELAPTGPSARFGHNAIWDEQGARMIVFGGQDGASFFNDTWAFQPGAGWAQLAQGGAAPDARYGAGGCYDPTGRMFITHGFTDSGRFDDTWALDLASGSWSNITPEGDVPVPRCLIRAVYDPVQIRIFIFGGQTTDTPFLDDLWSYSLSSDWRTLERDPKPTARNLYAMVFDADRLHMLMLGGNTPAGPSSEIWVYEAGSERWAQAEAANAGPSPRHSHDAVWLPDSRSMVLFGGNDGNADLNELWKLTDKATGV